jgi:hypothetical protein
MDAHERQGVGNAANRERTGCRRGSASVAGALLRFGGFLNPRSGDF